MKDLPWIVGGVLGLLWFIYFEAAGFRHPERYNTLSRFVSNIGSKFPLSIGIVCLVIGGLLVHFYWHWCPDLQAPGVGG